MAVAAIYTRLRDSRESVNLRRHGDSQLVASSVFFWVGLMLMAQQQIFHQDIIPLPEDIDIGTHLVVSYLASVMVLASSFLFYGIHLNGFSPVRSSLSRLAGSLLHVITLVSVVFVSTGHNFPLFVACVSIPFAVMFLWMAWLNAEDFIGAIRQRR